MDMDVTSVINGDKHLPVMKCLEHRNKCSIYITVVHLMTCVTSFNNHELMLSKR